MPPARLPLLIEVWKIARALGWDTELTRDRFERAGMLTKFPGCRDCFVMGDRFESQMPALVEPLLELLLSGKLKSTRGKRRH